jgi:hypothetical protein
MIDLAMPWTLSRASRKPAKPLTSLAWLLPRPKPAPAPERPPLKRAA